MSTMIGDSHIPMTSPVGSESALTQRPHIQRRIS